jgi:TP901 family phage tail tape measure protein
MSFGGASLGTAEGRITVDASQAISELGRVGGMMGQLDAKAGTLGTGVSDFHQSTVGLAQGMQHLGRVGLGVATATAAPFIAGVKAAMDMEHTMAGVNAVMDLTGTQFQDLQGLAQDLGRETIYTGTQAAEGIETLGRAGIGFEDIMAGAAQSATDLAAAGGIDVPRAAEVMAAAMEAFNIQGSESVVVADALAGMANQTLTDINQLGIGLGQVAGVAAAAGMGLDETTAFIGLMADNGIRGSDAATSMKNAILALLAPTDKAAGLMADLGIQLLDTEGNFVGLHGATQEFFDAWQDSGQTMSQFMQPLEDILGRDAVRTILFGMQAIQEDLEGGEKGWTDYLAAANDAGAAHDFASERMDSTRGAIERLTGSLGVLAENMGAGINAAIRAPIEGLTLFINALSSIPGPILNIVSVIGTATGVIIALGSFVL